MLPQNSFVSIICMIVGNICDFVQQFCNAFLNISSKKEFPSAERISFSLTEIKIPETQEKCRIEKKMSYGKITLGKNIILLVRDIPF